MEGHWNFRWGRASEKSKTKFSLAKYDAKLKGVGNLKQKTFCVCVCVGGGGGGFFIMMASKTIKKIHMKDGLWSG